MPDDRLTQAAQRAETHREKRQRLASEAADRFVRHHMTIVCEDGDHDSCAYGKHPQAMDCLCECHDEPDAAPAPAVDRAELAALIDGEIREVNRAWRAKESDDSRSEGEIAADFVISRGLITQPAPSEEDQR